MKDLTEGRTGEWMATSLGLRFYPQDPRPEEIHISDIANGLAGVRRYASQGEVKKHYSVGEHSTLMSWYARDTGWDEGFQLCTLLHDAAEAYLGDLAKSVKSSTGRGYKLLEKNVEEVIFDKYNVLDYWRTYHKEIKEIDVRMVPLEKEAIMRYPQPWAYDQYEPLEGVRIRCWPAITAKRQFLSTFENLAEELGLPQEEIEI